VNDLYSYLVNNPEYLNCFKNTTVIGVAGTNAAGKDSLMDLLKEGGYLVYNAGEHLRQVTIAALGYMGRGGNETPEGRTANAQRVRYPGGMVELGMIDWWARVAHLPEDLRPRGLVIGSIRGTGEAKRLHQIGGKLVLVDADRDIRYQRVASRQRADEPNISFEQFCKNEDAELAVGQTDPTKFGMAAVIESSDIVINNNGNDIDAFKREIKRILLENNIEV
jgi:dephospho-CoA kinase